MVWRVFVNFHWMEVHTSKLPMRDLPNTQHFQHVILESESILIQQTVSQEFHPKNRVKNPAFRHLSTGKLSLDFWRAWRNLSETPFTFLWCRVENLRLLEHLRILKACTLWRFTTEIWTNKKDDSEIVKCGDVNCHMFFVIYFFWGWARGAVNSSLLRKKMVYFLDWSGDEPESFENTLYSFFVWDYSLHRGSSFCCCRFVDHGNRNLDVLIGRDHKVENRTNWWAKLDNRERSNPPLTYPPQK